MVIPDTDLIPNFFEIFFRWVTTVWGLKKSFSAISLLVNPFATCSIIATSLFDNVDLFFDLFTLEKDLNDHSRIEEKVLIPKVREIEKSLKKL